MTWKPRNQNNIIIVKLPVPILKKEEAENRYKKLVLSIDNKMQQNFWDALVFDDKELELLANFGETIKFPHETTAVRALSILSTYILKKHAEENSYE